MLARVTLTFSFTANSPLFQTDGDDDEYLRSAHMISYHHMISTVARESTPPTSESFKLYEPRTACAQYTEFNVVSTVNISQKKVYYVRKIKCNYGLDD